MSSPYRVPAPRSWDGDAGRVWRYEATPSKERMVRDLSEMVEEESRRARTILALAGSEENLDPWLKSSSRVDKLRHILELVKALPQ